MITPNTQQAESLAEMFASHGYSAEAPKTTGSFYGGKRRVELTVENMPETEARLLVQEWMDAPGSIHKPRQEFILIEGNGVYSLTTVQKDFRKVQRKGAIDGLTDYLYKFFSLNFTIAHYDRHGWACEYPNAESIRAMVRSGGELGGGVPRWKTDVQRIVQEVF